MMFLQLLLTLIIWLSPVTTFYNELTRWKSVKLRISRPLHIYSLPLSISLTPSLSFYMYKIIVICIGFHNYWIMCILYRWICEHYAVYSPAVHFNHEGIDKENNILMTQMIINKYPRLLGCCTQINSVPIRRWYIFYTYTYMYNLCGF